MWSVIAKRMKHGHRSWSRRGGNHLAKILAKKCSGKLYEVTERLRSQYLKKKSRRIIWRDPDVGESTEERRKRIRISGDGSCGRTGRKDTGGEKAIATHGWILEISVETGLFQQKG